MKFLLATAIIAASSMAFADEAYIARQNTCAHLHEVLKEEGQLTLAWRLGSNTYFASPTQCSPLSRYSANYHATSDKRFCFVGYTCQDDIH